MKKKLSEDRNFFEENLIKIQTPKSEYLSKSGHAQEDPTHQKTLRCIPRMVLYHHTKNYQKQSSGSQDIQIWKMEKSGWPRIFDVNNSITKVYGSISSCKKLSKTGAQFRRYSNLKNQAIWLVESFRTYSWKTRISPDIWMVSSKKQWLDFEKLS